MPSVLDQIEKALTEESALYPPMSSMARKEWSLARDRTEKLLRNHAADLIAVARAAQRVMDDLQPGAVENDLNGEIALRVSLAALARDLGQIEVAPGVWGTPPPLLTRDSDA